LLKATIEDIPYINSIMNSPEVRPLVGRGSEYLDAADVFDDVLFLVGSHGVLMGEAMGDGEYLGLSAFISKGQGLASVIEHRKAIAYMFYETDAVRLNATVDRANDKARRNLLAMGFTRVVDRDNPRIMASLDWMDHALVSKAALKRGDEACRGNDAPSHERRLLGAFALTCEGGWPGKAIRLFNRYALLNHLPYIIPTHPTENVFSYGDKTIDLRGDHEL
jgi:hypothetical protein